MKCLNIPIVSLSGYAILQLPEFGRVVYLRFRDIITKRINRKRDDGIQNKKETTMDEEHDLCNKSMRSKKDGKQKNGINWYLRRRIQLIRHFQQSSANGGRTNRNKRSDLDKFLILEAKTLRHIIEEK